MPRLIAASALLLVAGPVVAQTPINSPFGRPGQVVGQSSTLMPAGQTFAPAGQPVGQPIGYNGPNGQPINTARPEGQMIDLSNLAAPLTAPLPPGLVPAREKSALEKVYDSWARLIGLSKPDPAKVANYTPGLSRRNRERNKFTWWRD
jgi:hypothetical protein